MAADSVLQRQTFKSGDQIFKEGDEGNMAYVVQEGEVEVVKIIDGHEKVLGTVGKGGIYGEMALIDSKPRMAAARAAGGVTIMGHLLYGSRCNIITDWLRDSDDSVICDKLVCTISRLYQHNRPRAED